MHLNCIGMGKVVARKGKRYVILPQKSAGVLIKQRLICVRQPHMAVYMTGKDPAEYFKNLLSARALKSREAVKYFRMVYDSIREVDFLPGRPLELPEWLLLGKTKELACFLVKEGPAVLVICRPEDIAYALVVLVRRYGRIVYRDGRLFGGGPIELKRARGRKTAS